ncbi:MAG: gamma carbonic anhydrase family protein [Gammaproteobacteria bacterium]|nr:gamma carbonic anhydrase family protein [Gammaproteobacteria bacterium]MYJ52764.1 gamma carbonic anhydrase family protein [Gammaproteobacteria bacterium]
MIYILEDRPAPRIAPSGYVADTADVIGWVTVGDQASVWFNTVLRGDNEIIRIGNRSNVQDCSVMHTDPGCPIDIGEDVTVGHSTMLHGCTVGSGSLIGIGSVILNRAVIGRDCLVGARSLVTENKTFPDRTLILGSPARAVRELSDEEILEMRKAAESYVNKIPRYRKMRRLD